MIKGGYILKPRIIQESDISSCSPCVRETWDYLIREANHKDYKSGSFEVKRGQLFRTYDEILDDLSWNVGWRKETYTKNQMKQAMKTLRDTGRIDTQKKPGGVLVTICKYRFYQNPDNYEQTREQTNEQTIEKPSTNHRQTSHIYKNEKNVKNDKNDKKREGDKSHIPSVEEVMNYFDQEGYDPEVGRKAFNIYNASLEDHPQRMYWRDSRDNLIKNWKMKMRSVWFKPENVKGNTNGNHQVRTKGDEHVAFLSRYAD